MSCSFSTVPNFLFSAYRRKLGEAGLLWYASVHPGPGRQKIGVGPGYPGEEYKEMLVWLIFHLGENSRDSILSNFLGLMICQYGWLWLSITQTKTLLATQFTALFYGRHWFKSSLAAPVARNDLTYMSNILSKAAITLMQAFYKQLWYLAGNAIVFLFLMMEVVRRKERPCQSLLIQCIVRRPEITWYRLSSSTASWWQSSRRKNWKSAGATKIIPKSLYFHSLGDISSMQTWNKVLFKWWV